jgi:hypothetical protein
MGIKHTGSIDTVSGAYGSRDGRRMGNDRTVQRTST